MSKFKYAVPVEAPRKPRSFHLLAKPTGAVCNLDCTYCYYLHKDHLLAHASTSRIADDLLEDFDTESATIRVLRMAPTGQAIQQHLHEKTTQIYVALQGRVRVEVEGKTIDLEPYRATVIHAGKPHRASPVEETAILMNISISPKRIILSWDAITAAYCFSTISMTW